MICRHPATRKAIRRWRRKTRSSVSLGGVLSGGSGICRQHDQNNFEVKHIELHADAEEVAVDREEH